MADVRAKEIKRAALNEILDYVNSFKGVLTESVYPEVVRMVKINAFRTLPPMDNPDYDPDEDEPPLEASWPHLEVIEIFFVNIFGRRVQCTYVPSLFSFFSRNISPRVSEKWSSFVPIKLCSER